MGVTGLTGERRPAGRVGARVAHLTSAEVFCTGGDTGVIDDAVLTATDHLMDAETSEAAVACAGLTIIAIQVRVATKVLSLTALSEEGPAAAPRAERRRAQGRRLEGVALGVFIVFKFTGLSARRAVLLEVRHGRT